MTGAYSILIVDDDMEIARGLAMRLRGAGFEVTTANNGLAGLAAVEEVCPDAILLDVRMPAMDGFEVLTNLRAREDTKTVPVIMLSANVAEYAKEKSIQFGADCFLEKPYDAARVIDALRALLAERSDTPAAIANAAGN